MDFSPSFVQTAGLMTVGGTLFTMAFQYIKAFPGKVYSFVQQRLRATVTIKEGYLYTGLAEYISNLPGVRITESLAQGEYSKQRVVLISFPSNDRYHMKWNNKKLLIKSFEKKTEKDDTITRYELSSFTMSVKEIEKFLQTEIIDKLINKKNKDFIPISQFKAMGGWTARGETEKRNKSTLLFNDDSLIDDILSDINQFLTEREWYKEQGIPHRRCFLLYGEPGNGKTSLIRCIAGELGMSISMLSLAGMDDGRLMDAFDEIRENSIVVLEDFDSMSKTARVNRSDNAKSDAPTTEGESGFNQLTFSGLLNALDGIRCSSNRIVFLTTNYKDSLDKALIRPGRCDRHVYIGNPSNETVRKLYRKFFPNDAVELVERFVAEKPEFSLSMAEHQERLLGLREEKRGMGEVVGTITPSNEEETPEGWARLEIERYYGNF